MTVNATAFDLYYFHLHQTIQRTIMPCGWGQGHPGRDHSNLCIQFVTQLYVLPVFQGLKYGYIGHVCSRLLKSIDSIENQ